MHSTTSTFTNNSSMASSDVQPASHEAKVIYNNQICLGKGSNMVKVYLGNFGTKSVAVKVAKFEGNPPKEAFHELENLVQIRRHQHLLKYYSVRRCLNRNSVVIAMEKCDLNLAKWIGLKDHDFSRIDIIRQITIGLGYLHSLGIVHGGVKPTNCFLKQVGKTGVLVKLSDFGLSRNGHRKYWFSTNLPAWTPPEILGQLSSPKPRSDEPSKMKFSSDIFPLGCVFYFALSGGAHPFTFDPNRQSFYIVENQPFKEPINLIDTHFGNILLIKAMINPYPEQRPSCDAILAHPIFWSDTETFKFFTDAADFQASNPVKFKKCVETLTLYSELLVQRPNSWRHLMCAQVYLITNFDTAHSIPSMLLTIAYVAKKFETLPKTVKTNIGSSYHEFVYYWLDRYPFLINLMWMALHSAELNFHFDLQMGNTFLEQYFNNKHGQEILGKAVMNSSTFQTCGYSSWTGTRPHPIFTPPPHHFRADTGRGSRIRFSKPAGFLGPHPTSNFREVVRPPSQPVTLPSTPPLQPNLDQLSVPKAEIQWSHSPYLRSFHKPFHINRRGGSRGAAGRAFRQPPRPTRIDQATSFGDVGNLPQAVSSSSCSPLLVQSMSYNSHYLSEFIPLECLGRGGFGVVFKAQKRIDERLYAVKRISLPTRQKDRDRVMREVKALAKLEHRHIVRYFNAWIESPPPGWLENNDPLWSNDTSSCSVSISRTTLDTTQTTMTTSSIQKEGRAQNITPGLMTNDSFITFEPTQMSLEYCTTSISTQSASTDDSVNDQDKSTGISYLYIQQELCQKVTLHEWLKSDELYDSAVVTDLFFQILDAVEYFHSQKLIHRDLKPSNIFFANAAATTGSNTNSLTVKIGDFGLVSDAYSDCDHFTKQENVKLTSRVGTRLYMSPEQNLRKPYDYKVDIYSLGLIYAELLSRFSTEMERIRCISDVRKGNFSERFITDFPKEVKIIKMMVSEEPSERPNAEQVKQLLEANICRGSSRTAELMQSICLDADKLHVN